MIFIMKQKTFMKKAKKMLLEKEYWVIDGEDPGAKLSKSSEFITDIYSRSIVIKAFTPDKLLIKKLLEYEKDPEDSNIIKLDNLTIDWLDDKSTIKGICLSIRAMVAKYTKDKASKDDKDINVFIVLPNKVYKHLGLRLKDKYRRLFKGVNFIYDEKELEKNPKLLTKNLSSKELDEIVERVEKIENKYKLNKDKKDKSKDKDGSKNKKDKKKKKKKGNKLFKELKEFEDVLCK